MAGWPPVWGVVGLFVRFAAGAFRGLPSVCVFGCFPFDFWGGMWDLIVSVPDHCLSFCFTRVQRFQYGFQLVRFDERYIKMYIFWFL